MFVVNVIIKRIFLAVLVGIFLLDLSGEIASARTMINPTGFTASQLDKMTDNKSPSTGGKNDKANGNGVTNVDVIGIITADQDGKPLRLPGAVFCDPNVDETYVVDNGKIAVYGGNLFPTASIGVGRGAETAMGVYVDKDGFVYVLQTGYYDKPPRISIYNAAFFPVKEIDLGAILGSSNPRALAIGQNGNIYVAFESGVRGVLVLDGEGTYSHWLKPMDLIFDQAAILQASEANELEEEGEASDESVELDFDISELAPILIPKDKDQVFNVFDEPGLGPVQVNDIQIDSDGNIYILSMETGKVYIYNPSEEFLYSFGEKGGSTGKLSQPKKLVVDEKKKAIYIVDATRHAILIYDLSGRFMHEFGGMGNRPGWFQYPNSISTNKQGHLVVADRFNRRVQVLDVHFEYKSLFQVPFVYDPNDIYQPRAIRTTKHYGPGFDEGQAFVDLSPEQEEILLILEEAGDVI